MSIKPNLRERKQELVRDAIFDAAIELFAAKGFDETTVEEVAQAAGVSRRSFFRYFASKDDLLAQNVIQYGVALTSAIEDCAPALSPLEIVKGTVLSIAQRTAENPRTRKVIEISERSASARQAHLSRLTQVEDNMAAAFAGRLKSGSRNDLRPRLLASLTLSVMNVAIVAWYTGEYPDVAKAANHAFSNLTVLFCNGAIPSKTKAAPVSKRKPVSGVRVGKPKTAKR